MDDKLYNVARCFFCGRFVKRGLEYMINHIIICPVKIFKEGIILKLK